MKIAKQTIHLSDGSVFVVASTPDGNIPDKRTIPSLCWLPKYTDKPIQVLGDYDKNDRDTGLSQTNMTRWPLVYDPIEDRVKVTAHGSVNLERNFNYSDWIKDCIGERNWINFVTDGDGNMDGASLWGMKTLVYGTNLFNGLGTIHQSGSNFELMETLDFGVVPVKNSEGWLYKGELIRPETHYYLFVGRVNRNYYNGEYTWQTSTGINYAIDKGVEGGKGTELWPFFSDVPLAMYHKDLAFFPNYPDGTMPFDTVVYKNSMVVDGNVVEQSGGLEITVVQLAITPNACYGITPEDDCYLLEETLVRGTIEDPTAYGTALDWRVYSRYRSLNRQKAWSPDIGWTRGK